MWLRKKKFKNLTRFYSANKIDNYSMGRGEKKNPKESREQVKNHKTNKCFP